MDQKLKRLIERCKAGVHITINEHRNYYEAADYFLAERDARGESPLEIDPVVRQQMIDTDTVINLHFYPDTPTGFYEIWHYDLEAALDEALACEGMPLSNVKKPEQPK